MQVINGSYATANPNRFFGRNLGLSPYYRARGDRFNRFVGETFSQTSATPDGYSAGGAIVLPLVAGEISATSVITEVSGTALAIGASLINGQYNWLIEGTSALSLQLRMSTSEMVLSFNGTASAAAVSGLDGSFYQSFEGESILAVVQPIVGTWTTLLSFLADLRGKMSMQGEWTPYTELSPQNLAEAVMSSQIEQGINLRQANQIAVAVAAGKTTISGTTDKTVVFRDINDTVNRITATISDGERLTVDIEV